jgi:antitoxin (DNA-binding transcriptional repressor) of toxin-antitoxin stability system
MTRISLEEADSQLSALVRKAMHGEEVVLTLGTEPVVRMMPFVSGGRRRRAGTARDLILHLSDDFDAPDADFQEYCR